MSQAEQSFRESLRAFHGTSGSRPSSASYAPLGGSSSQGPSPPSTLGGLWDSASSFVTRPSSQSPNTKTLCGIDEFCGLGRLQRFAVCLMCLAASALLFLIAFMNILIALISPSKFATPFTFGSILALISVGFLRGFCTHFNQLFSSERWVLTTAYLGSMAATVYFAAVVCRLLYVCIA